MIKFEHTEVYGWQPAIRGMRNPMESWDKSDSGFKIMNEGDVELGYNPNYEFVIGENDLKLMKQLCKAGTDHSKFMRMIICYCDITAPLYWWKEFDTYRNGVEKNSCSTMHCIHKREFSLDMFSHEHLYEDVKDVPFAQIIDCLNFFRSFYAQQDKDDWWQIIQLLPTSFNQKRTCMISYQALQNMYNARNLHKLDEWRIFCSQFVKSLPYSELITGEEE